MGSSLCESHILKKKVKLDPFYVRGLIKIQLKNFGSNSCNIIHSTGQFLTPLFAGGFGCSGPLARPSPSSHLFFNRIGGDMEQREQKDASASACDTRQSEILNQRVRSEIANAAKLPVADAAGVRYGRRRVRISSNDGLMP